MARLLMLSLLVIVVVAVAVHAAHGFWGGHWGLDIERPEKRNHQPRTAERSRKASWKSARKGSRTRALSDEVVELLDESCNDGKAKPVDFQNICDAFLKLEGCNERVQQEPDFHHNHHHDNYHHDNHHYEDEIHTNDQPLTGEEPVAENQGESQSSLQEYEGRDPDINNHGGFLWG